MSNVPYRSLQVLRALNNHPSGLTAAEIYNVCKQEVGNELPDAATVGKLIYSLRNGNKDAPINTSDAVGGKIHRITTKGQGMLAVWLHESGESPDSIVTAKQPASEDLPNVSFTDSESQIDRNELTIAFNPQCELEIALHRLCSLLLDSVNKPEQIAIAHLGEKLNALELIAASPTTHPDITNTLHALAIDLREQAIEAEPS